MKGSDFLKKINDIDDDLLEEAAEKHTRKRRFLGLWIAAACAAAILIGIVIWTINQGEKNDQQLIDAGMEAYESSTGFLTHTEESFENGQSVPSQPEQEPSGEPTAPSAETLPSEAPAYEETANADFESKTPDPENIVPTETQPAASDIDVPGNTDFETGTLAPENVTDGLLGYRVISVDVFYSESEDSDNAPVPDESVLTWFWQDGTFDYYIKGNGFVYYENGEEEKLTEAFAAGHISLQDLDERGIAYIRKTN